MNKPIASTPSQTSSVTTTLDVALLPSLVEPDSLAGQTVIVVDVLRATTTIINALSNGAEQVLPQPSVEAARATHQAFDGTALIGGERGGKIVDGFHQGNSPIEYTADVIAGKTLILATTNGTVAMERCRAAKRVLIGAMVNIEVIAQLVKNDLAVTVLCSGTDGVITSEDVLFAGAMIQRIIETRNANAIPVGLIKDSAMIALNHWNSTQREITAGAPLADFFRNARGGINLVKIGHDPDIVFASQTDVIPVVPELDVEQWSIRLRKSS